MEKYDKDKKKEILDKCMNEIMNEIMNDKPVCGSTFESISIQDNYCVLFQIQYSEGMVGEPHEYYSAYLVQTYPEYIMIEIEYEHLQLLYKKVEGKSNRINYWNWMKEFTQESIQERAWNELCDALSRVR